MPESGAWNSKYDSTTLVQAHLLGNEWPLVDECREKAWIVYTTVTSKWYFQPRPWQWLENCSATEFAIKPVRTCVSVKYRKHWSENSMCKLDNQQLVEFRLSYFSIILQNPAWDVFSQTGSRFEAVKFKLRSTGKLRFGAKVCGLKLSHALLVF